MGPAESRTPHETSHAADQAELKHCDGLSVQDGRPDGGDLDSLGDLVDELSARRSIADVSRPVRWSEIKFRVAIEEKSG